VGLNERATARVPPRVEGLPIGRRIRSATWARQDLASAAATPPVRSASHASKALRRRSNSLAPSKGCPSAMLRVVVSSSNGCGDRPPAAIRAMEKSVSRAPWRLRWWAVAWPRFRLAFAGALCRRSSFAD